MYLKTPGSTPLVLNDLYTVWIPKVPPRNEIIGHELKKEDQYWRRQPIPKYYVDRRPEEEARQEAEKILVDKGELPRITHFDPALEQYRRREWHRRIFGVWFMNNGEPVYITGTHYTYLQWTKLDHQENDGYPLFYESQLERFYFRQLCLEDPFCLGYLMVGARGFGKTSEEGACMLENITKPGHRRHAAIQSKSEDDAKEIVFQEKMVPILNNYPDFFLPQFSHGSDPKSQMVFNRPTIKGKGARKVKHGEDFELSSTISCYPPQNKALDGKTLSDVINDEIAKLKPEKDVDAYTRNVVNCKAVFRNNRKTGIIRATTTVEEMEQGGDECLEIWEESDPRIRDQNGYTISKLYKFFVSALKTQTQLADKYGRIPEDEALISILNEREPVKNDNFKVSLLMRKNPLTEQEAFLKDQSKSIYDTIILSNRLSELKLQKAEQKYRKYTIEWVNGKEDGDVELVENNEGPLTLFYSPDVMWSKNRKLLNACQFETDNNGKPRWLPCNNDLMRSACDPIRFVSTDDSRASKFAGHGGLMYIPDLDNGKEFTKDWISRNLMWEYHARHTDPTEDYENMIKLMRYFGHSIMPEANAGEFIKHLYSRGYQRFIIVRRNFNPTVLLSKSSKNSLGGDQAVHSHNETIESYVKRTAANIRRHGNRIPSVKLLEQLQKFNKKDAGKLDLAVSYGYLQLALEADLEDDTNDQKQVDKVFSYFNQYDISGSQSRLVQTGSDGSSDSGGDYDDESTVMALFNNSR